MSEDVISSTGTERSSITELAFADKFVGEIRDGEKWTTVRLPSEYDSNGVRDAISDADPVALVDESGDRFAIALINAVWHMRIIDVVNSEWRGYGDYSGLRGEQKLIETLEEYYPDHEPLKRKTGVDVVSFQVERSLHTDT